MTAPSAPDGPAATRAFTPDDEERLGDAYVEAYEFENFILGRLTAFVAVNVVPLSPGSEKRLVVEDATKSDRLGRWYVLPDWQQAPNNTDFHLEHRTYDYEGGPIVTTSVNLPKAWVYGETERKAEYALYLRLHEKFASSHGTG